MRSLYIFGVSLLSVVKLKATSVYESTCQVRNLSATVDDNLRLYFDGVEITGLPNTGGWDRPDFVDLPCATQLIGIHGLNWLGVAGIIASTNDDYVLTNSSWKCSNESQLGWEEIDFDDSTWTYAIEYGDSPPYDWGPVPGINPNASWIWLRQSTGTEEFDTDVFCRKRLDPNVCDISNPCQFGATCIDQPGVEYQCICVPGYTGKNCSAAIDFCESIPCEHGGSCLPIVNGYVCECLPGYTGNHCESDIDACDPNPCLNGGTCNNLGGDSFTCTCPIYATGVTCESPNYNEAFTCGTMLTWSRYNASHDFTRLCYFWTPLDDTNGRFTECRNVIQGLPLYDDYIGLLNAGGNFGCLVSQNYPDDLPATSYLSCADDYQQDIHLGNVSESDRLMICIRYPYEGLPDKEQH